MLKTLASSLIDEIAKKKEIKEGGLNAKLKLAFEKKID
jgi:hypothetical protein